MCLDSEGVNYVIFRGTLTALGIGLQSLDWFVYSGHGVNNSQEVWHITDVFSSLSYLSHHLVTEVEIGLGFAIPLSHVIPDNFVALKSNDV